VSDPGWERVKELLYQALQQDPAAREAYLDEACGGDSALRAEIESLLVADASAGTGFLDAPPGPSVLSLGSGWSDPPSPAAGGLEAGQLVAERYRLLRLLGEGGMGQVWLAAQTEPVQREVALKLIKAGMYDTAVVQRFLAERQSLAIMDHPAIAKVFDAGTTPQGQPYFVMEYVPGLPITDYCDQHRLGIAARLALFVQVCEGVQHAHQKALIHRDLKPANVLVVEVDGRPVPKIIDFGIAKAASPAVAGAPGSELTRFGLILGTPGYASPEQVEPGNQDIDTRSDVYSLGVILYVLLTGLQPFEIKRRQLPPLDVWLRQLREDDAPTPSTKLSRDRETAATAAEQRATVPRQLSSALRGDLDWIALKAVERDRERRYSSAAELAADLRRHLGHEPVSARPASATYRAAKYVRRHRVAVGVAAGLVVLLAGFTVLQARELHRTTLERDRANRERDRATRITDFMAGMFKIPDPSEARGNSVTAREVLDEASQKITTELAQDPDAQSQMMQVMATTYVNLGLSARAHDLAQRALDTRTRLNGPDDRRTLESMTQLAWVLDREGRDPEAESLGRRALAAERRILGPKDPLTLETMDDMDVILSNLGHYDEAAGVGKEAVEFASLALGPEHAQTLRAMNHLGGTLLDEGRYSDSEKIFRQLVETDRRVLGEEHPQTLQSLTMLANAASGEGRLAEAERLYRQALDGERHALGSEHALTALTMETLAEVLAAEGRLEEAENVSREALRIRQKILGPDHRETLISQWNLAEVMYRENQVKHAEELQRATLATQLRVLGAEHPDTLLTQTSLARTLIRERRYAEAETIASQTFDAQLRDFGPSNPDTLDTLREWGIALAYSRRYAEANTLFRDVIRKLGNSAAQRSAWYGFACATAAAGLQTEALRYLQEAVNHGYADADRLAADDDLKTLRDDPDFRRLVAALQSKAAAPEPPR
jgi:non-specific serine/threonine protein kinase/serine/threonine-protein kinase